MEIVAARKKLGPRVDHPDLQNIQNYCRKWNGHS